MYSLLDSLSTYKVFDYIILKHTKFWKHVCNFRLLKELNLKQVKEMKQCEDCKKNKEKKYGMNI